MLYRSVYGVQTAFEYFEKGARSKDAKSMAELSLCYSFGEGVEVSDPLAGAYAKMAAEVGDPVGMFLRAEHKLFGTVTDRNISVSFDLSKKALEKGYSKSKMTLGTCYFHGLTV